MDWHTLNAGQIVWLSSYEDSGPDVGLRLHLGGDVWLYAGEITRKCWEEEGSEVSDLGDDGGWWLRVENEAGQMSRLIGRVEQYAVQDMFDAIAGALRATSIPAGNHD